MTYPYWCLNVLELPTSSHPIVPWPDSYRRLVIGTDGQSNLSWYYDSIYDSKYPDQQFLFLLDGTVRKFSEPVQNPPPHPQLLGSLHRKLGDLLIATGRVDNVVWMPLAIGGTGIQQWSSTGEYVSNMVTGIKRLHDIGQRLDLMITMRGEYDNFYETPQEPYYRMAKDQIAVGRRAGFDGPWLIAVMSYVHSGPIQRVSSEVQAAQRQLTASLPNVFEGPYLDDLGDEYRYMISGTTDWTHFNGGIGRDTVAARWLEKIRPFLP